MLKLKTGRRTGLLFVGLLFVLSAAAYTWNNRYNQDPTQLFWSGIEAGMTTEGITCKLDKTIDGRRSIQDIALDLAGTSNARTHTTLTEEGTKVVTDAITTKTDNYVRYTDISVPRTANAQPDFSKVLNTWSKESLADSGNTSMFDQTVFGGCIVPLGNLSESESTKFLEELKQQEVFTIDAAASKWRWKLDEPIREYKVTVSPASYVPFMQNYAKTVGSNSLDKLNVSKYARQAPEELFLQIGTTSGHIKQITYSGQDVTIQLSNYGKKPRTTPPETTITAEELQKRLQAVK